MSASEKGRDYWQGVRDGFDVASQILGEAMDALEPPYDVTEGDLRGRLTDEIEGIGEQDQQAEGMRRALATVVESISELGPEATSKDVVRTARHAISDGTRHAREREEANE